MKNMMTGKDFEVEVSEEPILELKLRIETSQGVPLNDQIILYNGK